MVARATMAFVAVLLGLVAVRTLPPVALAQLASWGDAAFLSRSEVKELRGVVNGHELRLGAEQVRVQVLNEARHVDVAGALRRGAGGQHPPDHWQGLGEGFDERLKAGRIGNRLALL